MTVDLIFQHPRRYPSRFGNVLAMKQVGSLAVCTRTKRERQRTERARKCLLPQNSKLRGCCWADCASLQPTVAFFGVQSTARLAYHRPSDQVWRAAIHGTGVKQECCAPLCRLSVRPNQFLLERFIFQLQQNKRSCRPSPLR